MYPSCCSYWSTRLASKRPTQTRRPFTIRWFHTVECLIIQRLARIIVRTRTTTITTTVPRLRLPLAGRRHRHRRPTLITTTHDILIRTSIRIRVRPHPASMRPTNCSLLDPLNRRRLCPTSTPTDRNSGPRKNDRVPDPPARSWDSEAEWPKVFGVRASFWFLFFFSSAALSFFFGFQNPFCTLDFVGFEAIGYVKSSPFRHFVLCDN